MPNENEQNLVQLVEETMRTLHDKGIPPADLAPLVKLHDAVKALNEPQSVDAAPPAPAPPAPAQNSGHHDQGRRHDPDRRHDTDRRRGEIEASEDLMARASAIIDVMVQSGQTPEHASQVITRQLLATDIQLPMSGGDARAWKRLLYWRNNLLHYKREGPAWDAYCAFKEQLAGIPPADRLRAAVGERLWDQRKKEISSQEIA